MCCLVGKDGVCKSSANCIDSTKGVLQCTNMSQCSNGAICTDKVVVSAKQVAKSIRIDVIFACTFINMVCGDSESAIWCILVRPVVN